MIKIKKKLKGKDRPNAVLRIDKAKMNFNIEPDKAGLIPALLSVKWYEDEECKLSGLENSLEDSRISVMIHKDKTTKKNMYIALMLLDDLKKGVLV